VVYAELPGTQHNFDFFPSLRFHAVADAVEDFTAWVRTDGADGPTHRGAAPSGQEGDPVGGSRLVDGLGTDSPATRT
jgi:hypothetical protein